MEIEKLCFLCKEFKDVTQEHVFPKWLQRRFKLFDQKIILLNGSTIQYKDIRIPCCADCNNKYLSIIEDKVRNWLINGKEIDLDILYLWISKIQYGLHYKEMFLKKNIVDKYSEMIIDADKIFKRESQNLFLYKILNSNSSVKNI